MSSLGIYSLPTRITRMPRRRRGPLIRLTLKRALLAPLVALVGFHTGFFLVISFFCLLYSFVNPPVTTLMIYRSFVSRYPMREVRFVPLTKIPRYVQRMFVKIEDNTFYQHPGIDLKSIKEAYQINQSLGYVYYGGSTITQQLARTLFLTPNRTYLRKYLEALIAIEMDLLMSKQRILELYINYIEYGKGVYGIGAAARYHFQKKVSQLTVDEYRRLVTIVASPLKYNMANFTRRRALSERYEYLLNAFP